MLTRPATTLAPFHQLRQEMDRLFDRMFEETPLRWRPSPSGARAFPPLNIWDDANSVHVEAEVPGLEAGEIDLSITGDELTIRGDRRPGKGVKEESFVCRERDTGPFSRSVRLPCEVDPGDATASIHEGVLMITLPKAAVAATRRIEVKARPS